MRVFCRLYPHFESYFTYFCCKELSKRHSPPFSHLVLVFSFRCPFSSACTKCYNATPPFSFLLLVLCTIYLRLGCPFTSPLRESQNAALLPSPFSYSSFVPCILTSNIPFSFALKKSRCHSLSFSPLLFVFRTIYPHLGYPFFFYS